MKYRHKMPSRASSKNAAVFQRSWSRLKSMHPGEEFCLVPSAAEDLKENYETDLWIKLASQFVRSYLSLFAIRCL